MPIRQAPSLHVLGVFLISKIKVSIMEKVSIPISMALNRKIYRFALRNIRRAIEVRSLEIVSLEAEAAEVRRVLDDMDKLQEPAEAPANPTPAPETPALAAPKRKLTPAGRKAIAAAQKARWAKTRAEKKIANIRKKL